MSTHSAVLGCCASTCSTFDILCNKRSMTILQAVAEDSKSSLVGVALSPFIRRPANLTLQPLLVIKVLWQSQPN
jgi:hypothetical protein